MPVKILFLSAEAAPWSKTGGLGDVAGALPKALAARGHQVLLVTPYYRRVALDRPGSIDPPLKLEFPFGPVTATVRLAAAQSGLQPAFIDIADYFQRDQLYGYPDDARRFAAFSVAALNAAVALGFAADILHLNDWQTGPAAIALKGGYTTTSLGKAKSVMTIHNLAYQGNFGPQTLAELGLPAEQFTSEGFEFYGHVSFLKAGLTLADAITTVSPTYAKEIQTKEGGVGFDGVLRARAEVLHGISNGIDVREWNPATDPHLPHRFTAEDLSGKEICARALLERLGLPTPSNGSRRPPLFASVGRLVEQKGVDLMLQALPGVLDRGAQVVALGTGEERYVHEWKRLRARYPKQVGLFIGFDEGFAHLVEAGADFFLMPSKFEPSGLNQMYSQRYGTVPIVRATGGLVDTVVPQTSPEATGLMFRAPTAHSLWLALEQALAIYQQPRLLDAMRRRGMAKDFSWNTSAAAYERLYRDVAELR